LVQALGRLELPTMPLSPPERASVGSSVTVAGYGGLPRALKAKVIAVEPFAGYWEYLLDRAVFTAPAYPNWSGAAAIDADGELIGIGSLHVERAGDNGRAQEVNMFVPTSLLTPVLGDMLALGRSPRPARPWLGLYTVEHEGKLVVAGLAGRGPAHAAGIRTGDVILAVDGDPVEALTGFYRQLWARGPAGPEFRLSLEGDERR